MMITGPAKSKIYSLNINNIEIKNIPSDIPSLCAEEFVTSFLNRIVAFEFPSSLFCNCNCQYCYITEKWLKNKKISLEDLTKVVESTYDMFVKGSNKKKTYISAWGAEPFCNLDTLDFLIDFCIEHNMHFNTSTNGTINNDSARNILYKMFKNNVADEIQVSIDGPKHIHDMNRPLYSDDSGFDKIYHTLEYLDVLKNELHKEDPLYHICSTLFIHDGLKQDYLDCCSFFLDKENNPLYFSPMLPMRIENHLAYTKDQVDIIEDTIRESVKYIASLRNERPYLKKNKIYDFYTAHLFGSNTRNSYNNYPECSAGNSQVAVDIDGSIYMCHGPITTSLLKSRFKMGNVFENWIDFKKIIFTKDVMYRKFLYSGYCKNCIVQNEATGYLCFSCPVSYASLDGNPSSYDVYRCELYKRLFPVWKELYELSNGCDDND